MNRRAAALPAAIAALLLLAGCSQSSTGATPSSSASSGGATPSASASLGGSITVDAAASLNGVFPELATAFEQQHPGTKIVFSFGGSSTLAAQIVGGAPVDVFAAASTKTMQTVQDAKRTAADPVTIARNQLEIAVPKGNPGKVTGLADFADAAKTIVVCAKEVPCGAAAQQVFTLGKVSAKPDSYEPDVTAVLTKVRTGEADAGLVYVTDVEAAGSQVQGIRFDESDQAITDVVIAPLTDSGNGALAQAWVDFVAAQGGDDLKAAGFLAP